MPTLLDQLPDSAKDALKLWDSNEPVITVRMGGELLTPTGEQTIHIAVFELIRLALPRRIVSCQPKKASEILDGYLSKIDSTRRLNMTGPQAAAAKHLAYCYLVAGYKTTVEAHRNLRRIAVVKHFPKA